VPVLFFFLKKKKKNVSRGERALNEKLSLKLERSWVFVEYMLWLVEERESFELEIKSKIRDK
jgi:hypothetical protein